MQHIVTLPGLETGKDIADHIVFSLSHVDVTGRVGKHFQVVEFLAGPGIGGKEFMLAPIGLPFLFNRVMIVNHQEIGWGY